MAVSLGPKKATGRSGNMKIPGFIIWFISMYGHIEAYETMLIKIIEGRTLFTQKLVKYVNGTEW